MLLYCGLCLRFAVYLSCDPFVLCSLRVLPVFFFTSSFIILFMLIRFDFYSGWVCIVSVVYSYTLGPLLFPISCFSTLPQWFPGFTTFFAVSRVFLCTSGFLIAFCFSPGCMGVSLFRASSGCLGYLVSLVYRVPLPRVLRVPGLTRCFCNMSSFVISVTWYSVFLVTGTPG